MLMMCWLLNHTCRRAPSKRSSTCIKGRDKVAGTMKLYQEISREIYHGKCETKNDTFRNLVETLK